jgi:hypothetical protein
MQIGRIRFWSARTCPRPPQDGLAAASFQSGDMSPHSKALAAEQNLRKLRRLLVRSCEAATEARARESRE